MKTKLFNYVLFSTLIFGSSTVVYLELNNQNNKTNNIQELKNKNLLSNNNYKIKDMQSDENINAAIISLPDGNDHLYTWGNNFYGALGYETNEFFSPLPREVILPVQGEMVELILGHNDGNKLTNDNGESMGVVIRNSKTGLNELWMWGSNAYGKLGLLNQNWDPKEDETTTPHKIFGNSKANVEKVVQTKDTTAILYEDVKNGVVDNQKKLGLLGSNEYGQLAYDKGFNNGSDHKQHSTITYYSNINDGIEFNNIWAGENIFYVEAIDKNSNSVELYSWGENNEDSSLLGVGSNKLFTSSFTLVTKLNEGMGERIVDISSSGIATSALIENKNTHVALVYSWGISNNGSIGFESPMVETIQKPKLAYNEEVDNKEFTSIHYIGQNGIALEYFDKETNSNKLLFTGNEYGISSSKFKSFDIPNEVSNEGNKIIFGSSGSDINPYAIGENNYLYKFDSSINEFNSIGNFINNDIDINLNIDVEFQNKKNRFITFHKPEIINNTFNNELSEVYVSSEKLNIDHQKLNINQDTIIDNDLIKLNETYNDFIVEAHFKNSIYSINNKTLSNEVTPIKIHGPKSNTPIIVSSIIIPFVAIMFFILFVLNKKGIITITGWTGIRSISKKTNNEINIVLNKKSKYLDDKDLIKIYSDEIELNSKITIDKNENIIIELKELSKFTKYKNIKMKYYNTKTGNTEEKIIKGSFKTKY